MSATVADLDGHLAVHYDRLRSICAKRVGDDCADVLHDAYLVARRKVSTCRGEDVGGWFWTILMRAVSDRYRDPRIQREYVSEQAISFRSAPEVDAVEIIAAERATLALSPFQREAVRLRALGYSSHEAAERLDTSRGSIRMAWYRARAKAETAGVVR